MSIEPKPCPFCGGKADLIDRRKDTFCHTHEMFEYPYAVGCNNEGCCARPHTFFYSMQWMAINAWNARFEERPS